MPRHYGGATESNLKKYTARRAETRQMKKPFDITKCDFKLER